MTQQLSDARIELLLLVCGEQRLRHGGGFVEASPRIVNEILGLPDDLIRPPWIRRIAP